MGEELESGSLIGDAEVGEELNGGLIIGRVGVEGQNVGVVADHNCLRDVDRGGEVPFLLKESGRGLVDSSQDLRYREVGLAERSHPGTGSTFAFPGGVDAHDWRRDGSTPVLESTVCLLDVYASVGSKDRKRSISGCQAANFSNIICNSRYSNDVGQAVSIWTAELQSVLRAGIHCKAAQDQCLLPLRG